MRSKARVCCMLLFVVVGCAQRKNIPGETNIRPENKAFDSQLQSLIADLEKEISPLEKDLNLAYWDATNTGRDSSYKKVANLEVAIRSIFSDPKRYSKLKEARVHQALLDPLLAREVSFLIDAFAENQIQAEKLGALVSLSTEVEKSFNEFRPTLDGLPVSDNDIALILKTELDSQKRRMAWEAYQSKGSVVKDKLLALVKLRNEIARNLGYQNYYEMRLQLDEQDTAQLFPLFQSIAAQTDILAQREMAKARDFLAARYGIRSPEIRSWHFEDPFLQEAPSYLSARLDPFFERQNPRDVVLGFFQSLGLDPADILARSDLSERDGKAPQAYCIDIDRNGDIRILANLRKSEKWTSILLHEMGHALYGKYLDPKLPFFLRTRSHTLITEGIAMMFERLISNPSWLQSMLGIPKEKLDPVAGKLRERNKLSKLFFARWALVMVFFERALYENPDQDLNHLWRELKKRYQLENPPEQRDAPDWAAKIHFISSPVYYHNYLLGELFAAQLLHHMGKNILNAENPDEIDFVGLPQLGEYLRKNIFAPGASLRWDELIQRATGEPLNPQYFIESLSLVP
jgi:peptidyl-dipeptidase A